MSKRRVERVVSIKGETKGVTEATAAMRKLSDAVDAAGEASERSARSGEAEARVTENRAKRTLSMAGAMERMRRQMDESYRSHQRYEDAQRKIDLAFQQGALDLGEYNRMLGLAKTHYDADTRAAATLRAQLDPLAAAQGRLNVELAEYAGLAQRGAISAAELGRAQTMARSKFEATSAALMKQTRILAENDNAVAARRTNLRYQVFDIGQGVTGGMSPLMVLSQQGPQIVQMYAGQGGVNAALKDTTAVLGGLVRMAAPWIAAAAGIYGAYKLISSYSADAALKVSDATKALAEQAMPMDTLKGRINDLQTVTDAYAKAIRGTAKDQSIATASILANSRQEFEAKKSLLTLELKRQRAAIEVQRAELAQAAQQIKADVASQVLTRPDRVGKGFADPAVGTFVNALDDDLLGLEKTMSVIANHPLNDKMTELRANLSLSEIATQGLEEALKTTFDQSVTTSTEKLAASAGNVGNAYRDLEKDVRDRIDMLKLEGEMIGKTGVEAERYRLELELIQKATDKGRKPTDDQIQQLRTLADEYGRVASSVEAARALDELGFERDQIMRSEIDQAIYSKIRDIGLDINSIDAQRIADAMRINKEMQQQRDTAQEFADVLSSAFSDLFTQPLKDLDDMMSPCCAIGADAVAAFFHTVEETSE